MAAATPARGQDQASRRRGRCLTQPRPVQATHGRSVPHEKPHAYRYGIYWGERPKAFITSNEGASATTEEIIAFCRERLARYKGPDAIEFGPLPKTSTGEVQKFVLRDREWAVQ